MKVPRADPGVVELFKRLVPSHPAVTIRPMFGNLAAFVQGNMFAGVLGTKVFVRLLADGRTRALLVGGRPFAPVPGKTMRDYVEWPASGVLEEKQLAAWLAEGLHTGLRLPPKAGSAGSRRKPRGV